MINSENTVLIALIGAMDDMLELDKASDEDMNDIMEGVSQLRGIIDRIAERNKHDKDFCVQPKKDISS